MSSKVDRQCDHYAHLACRTQTGVPHFSTSEATACKPDICDSWGRAGQRQIALDNSGDGREAGRRMASSCLSVCWMFRPKEMAHCGGIEGNGNRGPVQAGR